MLQVMNEQSIGSLAISEGNKMSLIPMAERVE